MGVEILNLKFMGLYFVILFFDAATAGNKGLVLEVVSIYNDNFTTPNSKEPYFIEVHRCIDDSMDCSPGKFAIQDHHKEIKIVVPDLNKRTKFYRYVVYSHTSCKCGGQHEERKLYNKTVQEVNETVFQKEYKGNPVNLRNKCEFCDKPQPRYRLDTRFKTLPPESRYYLQYQCLPGCWNESEFTTTTVAGTGESTKTQTFLNDTNCTAYAPSHEPRFKGNCPTGNMQQSNPAPQNLVDRKKSSNDNESKDDLIISIGSARLLLAALVLSFVLLIVLMLDFGLCRKKKGFFYALCNCTGGMQ